MSRNSLPAFSAILWKASMFSEGNRLEQVAKLYQYLMENFNFSMRNGVIRFDEAAGNHASLLVGCNFVDLQRYVTLDHIRLGNEPPRFFLHEIRKCNGVCRIDGAQSCYCNGDCFSEHPCHWLRYDSGRPYCFLAHPWNPQFPKRKESYMELRAIVIKDCPNEHMKNIVSRIMPDKTEELEEEFT